MTAGRVLLIEDDPDVSMVSAEMLRVAGFEVAVADRVSKALRACAERTPDAAVVDLRLPGESGWEFVRQARERWPKMSLVVYTVHSGEQDVLGEARRFGITDVVDKSENPEVLIELLRRRLAVSNTP